VVDAHLDQVLAHRERDEPLGGLARDAELAGDLVLGVAGDVVEPGGTRGVVEPVFLASRAHRAASSGPAAPRARCGARA